ncbi:unnamed protein product [Vitrella brassicaformis CCMP3155]|uniref:Uncharacterized protein n=1 Tax=Vitrella brassicaformis (strain CCMP3155) TaxID=1169540 RepID=A0A0G4EP67_VITBC|nr:unnamed protein product [Vitrella brassicaformis CCMP3155]|eukprot:CEL99246.1 unnamed protein product [Vitrella brassicaformis CCMP3155]
MLWLRRLSVLVLLHLPAAWGQNVVVTPAVQGGRIVLTALGSAGLLLQRGDVRSMPEKDSKHESVVAFLLEDPADITSISQAGPVISNVNAFPFVGISAKGGTLVVSGGTGGLSAWKYDTSSARIGDNIVLNEQVAGVIGFPDVTMASRDVALMSTDFESPGTSRFGILVLAIDEDGVRAIDDIRIPGSGFENAVGPANFALVTAVQRRNGAVLMYTAHGSMTVTDVTPLVVGKRAADVEVRPVGTGGGGGAVSVAVASPDTVLFARKGAVMVFDTSNGAPGTLIDTIDVSGRVTSVGGRGPLGASVTEGAERARSFSLPTS